LGRRKSPDRTGRSWITGNLPSPSGCRGSTAIVFIWLRSMTHAPRRAKKKLRSCCRPLRTLRRDLARIAPQAMLAATSCSFLAVDDGLRISIAPLIEVEAVGVVRGVGRPRQWDTTAEAQSRDPSSAPIVRGSLPPRTASPKRSSHGRCTRDEHRCPSVSGRAMSKSGRPQPHRGSRCLHDGARIAWGRGGSL